MNIYIHTHTQFFNIYMYIHTQFLNVCIYMYILEAIYRQPTTVRERSLLRGWRRSDSRGVSICTLSLVKQVN